MRLRNFLIAVAVLAMAVPGFANAGSPNDRATGGGQILVSSDGGAGDTIAFTARNTGGGDAAQGQLQVVDRTGGTGKDNVRLHGVVTCLRVDGTTAKLGGTITRASDGDTTPFTLVVQDNGEGAAAPDDTILLERVATPDCDEDDSDDDGNTDLARGNAQVYDAQ